MALAANFEVDSAVEPVSDGFASVVGNQQYTNVTGGCDITYSNSDLTFDIAAGAVQINGVPVAVPADTGAGPLVADTTYSTWEWIVVDDTGASSVIAGTAGANPAVPSIDTTLYAAIALVLVEANQTVANSITVKTDKRTPSPVQIGQLNTNFSVSTNTTLGDLAGLSFFLPASGRYYWEINAIVNVESTPGIKLGVTGPVGMACTGMAELYSTSAVKVAVQSSMDATPLELNPGATSTILRWNGVAVGDTTHAGVVQFQAAQQTSDAMTTEMNSFGSALLVRKIT